ncbi:MAG: hypothetical protein EA397_11215 [Deltaproteobacteria bacterium]|nr:MAG: hypothetical protein EA397_11215 [Deltaproteobacteria bacterium]
MLCSVLALAGAASVDLLLPSRAQAQDNRAERLRISEEMKKLAQRNAWSGVERKYAELRALRMDLPADDHLTGAQSARFLGKTFEVYNRLSRAYQITEDSDTFQEMQTIDAQYGRIELKGSERFLPRIEPKVMPFAPDARKSIEWANEVLTNTGSFKGMLPAGEYRVACQEFTVAPGPNFLVDDIIKPKKRELLECLGQEEGDEPSVTYEGLIGYNGPVAMVGYNFMANFAPNSPAFSSSDPGLHQVQGQTATGSGISAQVGYEIGFNGFDKMFGLALTGAYTGMYGGRTQYARRPSSFNGGSIWLAGTARPGDFRFAFGPTWSMVYGSGTGAACWFELAPGEDWAPPATGTTETSCRRPSEPRYEPNNLQWRGLSLAPGASLSAGYGFMEVGSFQGVVELGGSWATDGQRHIVNAAVRVGFVPAIKRFQE